MGIVNFPEVLRGVQAHKAKQTRPMLAKAIAAVICENLESRLLFTTYNVPFGHTAVYLENDSTQGDVVVHLDSPTGTVGHTFTNPSDTDVIDCGSAASHTFTFFDQVPVYYKPSGGIVVEGGSNETLEVDAGIDDQVMTVSASTSSSGTVTDYDIVDGGISATSSFSTALST